MSQMKKILAMGSALARMQADIGSLREAVEGRSPDIHELIDLEDVCQMVEDAADDVGDVRDSLRWDLGVIASSLRKIDRDVSLAIDEIVIDIAMSISVDDASNEYATQVASIIRRAQEDRRAVLRRHGLTAHRWNRLVEERTSFSTGLRLGIFVYGVG